jgi:hypothetical protein
MRGSPSDLKAPNPVPNQSGNQAGDQESQDSNFQGNLSISTAGLAAIFGLM